MNSYWQTAPHPWECNAVVGRFIPFILCVHVGCWRCVINLILWIFQLILLSNLFPVSFVWSVCSVHTRLAWRMWVHIRRWSVVIFRQPLAVRHRNSSNASRRRGHQPHLHPFPQDTTQQWVLYWAHWWQTKTLSILCRLSRYVFVRTMYKSFWNFLPAGLSKVSFSLPLSKTQLKTFEWSCITLFLYAMYKYSYLLQKIYTVFLKTNQNIFLYLFAKCTLILIIFGRGVCSHPLWSLHTKYFTICYWHRLKEYCLLFWMLRSWSYISDLNVKRVAAYNFILLYFCDIGNENWIFVHSITTVSLSLIQFLLQRSQTCNNCRQVTEQCNLQSHNLGDLAVKMLLK